MTPTADAASIERANSESSSAMRRGSGSDTGSPAQSNGEAARSTSGRSSTAELGGMLLAFIFGGVGFAVRILWIPALVVMAVVFGLILADRRTLRSTKGIVPEIVANVVNEARDIYHAASGTSGEPDHAGETKETFNDAHNPSSPKDAPRPQNETGRSDGASRQEESGVGPVDGIRANGHSPLREGNPSFGDADAVLNPPATIDTTPEAGGEVATETVEAMSAGIDSVVTKSVQATVEESRTMEPKRADPEDADPESGDPGGPPPLANGVTDASANPFPVRLIISADQMAARNPLLRPVRKRLLGAATSISQVIVQMATDPQDDPSH